MAIIFRNDGKEVAELAGMFGDRFYTLRKDNRLNGAVEANGAEYNFADLAGGSDGIKTLLDGGSLPYVSIAAFDALVASDGGCDCFGYDGPDSTSFKVPKIQPRVLVRCQKATAENGGVWYNL